MTIHDIDDTTDEFDRDELSTVIRLRSVRQLIDTPAWDQDQDQDQDGRGWAA